MYKAMMFQGEEEECAKTASNMLNVNQEKLIQPLVNPSIFLQLTRITLGVNSWTMPNLVTGIQYRNGIVKSMTVDTLAGLIHGEFVEQLAPATVYQIIDCRHPFEFFEGHIMGAQNLHTRDQIQKDFLAEKMEVEADGMVEMESQPLLRRPCIYVFYCEFSLEQAPKLMRFLRGKDREQNYPELYLLQDGYREFSYQHPQLCCREVVPMESPVHKDELLGYSIGEEEAVL